MEQTRGNRVRELRKHLDLTLDQFGERICVTKSALSKIERGASGLSDKTAKLICQTFHVNEAWLLDGVGEMFATVPDALLGELYRRYDCSETSQWIIEEFLKLGPVEQDVIYQYIRSVYLRSVEEAAESDAGAAPDTADSGDSIDLAIERKVADYRRRLELEARREGASDASNQEPATA